MPDLFDLMTPTGFWTEIAKQTGLGDAATKSSLNKDDIDAIAAYFEAHPAKTTEAAGIASMFRSWYNRLGILDSYGDQSYETAKQYRDEYNLANATTTEEKKAAKTVQKTGVTREQAYGLPADTESLWDKIKGTAKKVGTYSAVGAGAGVVAYVTFKIARIVK